MFSIICVFQTNSPLFYMYLKTLLTPCCWFLLILHTVAYYIISQICFDMKEKNVADYHTLRHLGRMPFCMSESVFPWVFKVWTPRGGLKSDDMWDYGLRTKTFGQDKKSGGRGGNPAQGQPDQPLLGYRRQRGRKRKAVLSIWRKAHRFFLSFPGSKSDGGAVWCMRIPRSFCKA